MPEQYRVRGPHGAVALVTIGVTMDRRTFDRRVAAGELTVITDDELTAAPGGDFDPADHPVAEVRAYLARADDGERDRVLAAERAGKARKSITGDDDE